MTLTINLTPEEEARLRAVATAQGLPVETYLREMIAGIAAPASAPDENAATIALLESWREEDATDDPEEIAQAEAEWKEFKQNLEENPLSLRESEE